MGGLWDEAGWACAAMVTPIDASGRIDADRLARFGQRLMGAGLNGLVLFGTMGEGPAFPAAERLDAAAALIDRHGFEPGRLVLGIGSCAPAETAWLARRAGELGIAAVLATPPFFFRDVQQEGVYRFYATLAEAAGRGGAPLLLYHIPQVAGVPLSADTVARLVEGHPEVVRGIKDSGADLPYTRALLKRLDGRAAVLVGAEQHIAEAMTLGARGTVCGMANLIPATTARLVAGDPEASAPVAALAQAFEVLPVIPAVKAAVGEILGDPAWRACVPPLLPATDEQAAALVRHAEP
jgi:4-hydroxy-tetrahydrodipicolinate synthase